MWWKKYLKYFQYHSAVKKKKQTLFVNAIIFFNDYSLRNKIFFEIRKFKNNITSMFQPTGLYLIRRYYEE